MWYLLILRKLGLIWLNWAADATGIRNEVLKQLQQVFTHLDINNQTSTQI